jgi:GTP-binding protein EngB required for normal cell division
MKNETGVMVLGKSNIGKTTLCHLIHKSKLKVVDNFGMFAINLEDPNSTDAKIGMEGISCTAIPNYFKLKVGDKTLNLYDCPGFCDSNKFESLISNCYYVYNTFLNIPQNLFVLVVLEDELRGGTARGFIQSVELFLKLFEIASDNTEAGVPDSAKKKITL